MPLDLTGRSFPKFVRYGTIILIICAVSNVYTVMRYWELHHKMRKAEEELQKLVPQQQVLQRVMNDFLQLSQRDPNVVIIFQRNNLVNAGQPSIPGGGGR